jgi:hypothetical protein
MKNFRTIFSIAVLVALFAQGCEKWRDNRDPQTALDNALAESSFHDIFRIVLAETKEHEGFPSNVDSCSSRSAVTTNGNYPVTLSVAYGNTDCAFNYHISRNGNVVISLNQPFSQANAQASITFENFYLNGYLIEGVVTITHKGITGDKSQYRLQVADGKVTSKNGRIVSWSCDRTFERSAGQESLDFVWDDAFSITGSSAGVNHDGRSFTSEIKEALIFEMVCRWITKGEVELSVEELKNIVVNYGDGSCDNDAESKVGKRSYNAKLK